MTAYIDIRGPNRELQLPIRSSNSCNSFDSCNSCLNGVILHEGDSIENENYFPKSTGVIIQPIMFLQKCINILPKGPEGPFQETW